MNQGYLREVTKEDMMLLYHWVNDIDVRKNSFQTHTIDIEEHKNWFQKKIESERCSIYIFMVDTTPIGQIRIEYEGNQGTINYSIDKKYQGQGYGKILLELAEQKVKETRKEIIYLMGEVKKENIPSKKKFEELGYEKTEYIRYSKKINSEK